MKRINKGFTLIELMAVVVIISLIAILTFPNIVNQIEKSKKANTNNIKTVVIEAAKKYVRDNIDEYDRITDSCLPINTLVENNYIDSDIVSIKDYDMTKKYIKIVKSDSFKYSVVDEC